MNPDPHNSADSRSSSAEETLRLIASLPSPDGLEERVHAALHRARERGVERDSVGDVSTPRGRVLAWPRSLRRQSNWMRNAAAAAIVFVVVGGGWGVYQRVEHGQRERVIMMPSRVPVAGGFSSAGAMRRPETVPGPVVEKPAEATPTQPAGKKKPAARPAAKAAAGTGASAPQAH